MSYLPEKKITVLCAKLDWLFRIRLFLPVSAAPTQTLPTISMPRRFEKKAKGVKYPERMNDEWT